MAQHEISSIVLSKVTPPRMRGVFPRERLFRLLDSLGDHPAIWVQAPGGSGKSTLVASHLDARCLPRLWFQIDGGDADIATFFHYLREVAVREGRGKGEILPTWTPDQILSLPLFARRFFTALFAILPPAVSIVFDNYQDLPADAPLHEVIREGFGVIPSGTHIIVISREGPPPAFARLLANGVIGHVGWEELSLDLAEARELVKTKAGLDLPSEKLGYLHDKTEGWAAGIVLMVEHLRRMGPDFSMLERIDSTGVFDYFAAEIFDLAGQELQDFLLKTAFLNRITVPVAETLTGNDRASQILSGLARNNYFTTRHQLREASFQYHQLFQEFLRARARERLAPPELKALMGRTAELLHDAGLIEDAGRLYVELKEWDILAAMALDQAQGLVAQGRTVLLGKWLTGIPPAVANRNPWILFWLGVCSFAATPQESRALFERAFAIFRERDDRTGLFLSWCAVVDTAIHVSEYVPMRQWIEVLEDVLKADSSFPAQEIEVRVSLSLFNAAAFVLPDHPNIAAIRERAYAIVCRENIADANLFLSSGIHLVVHFIYQGDFSRARLILDLLRGAAGSEEATDLVRSMVKTIEAHYAFATGALDACIEKAFESLALAAETGIRVWEMHNYGHALAAALAKDDGNLIGEFAPKMSAGLAGARTVDKSYYHWMMAWYYALQEDFQQARQHLEIAFNFGSEIGFLAPRTAMLINMAEVSLQLGNLQESVDFLKQAHPVVKAMDSVYLSFCYGIIDSILHFDRGDYETGTTSLRNAFVLGRENRIENFFFWRPALMTRLCIHAIETEIEVEYAASLVRNRRLLPAEPPLHLENWPWTFRIYTLGDFRLIRDGKALVFSGKVQKKPLELLKALVALGGREARGGQLMDLLWPEADGDTARTSLKTTLHRLRQILGIEEAVLVSEGRLALNDSYVWTDVNAFNLLLRQAQYSAETGDEKKAVALSEKAVALYSGPFLAQEDKPWVEPLRSKLTDKLVHHLITLGRISSDAGDFRRSVDWYERGLEADDCNEYLYQALMHCYRSMGLNSRAIAVYERCRKALAAGMNIAPAAATEKLYCQILAEGKIS